ncbi:MAG: DUF4838 domain-containing protein [Acidobacteriota bacterium]|nr:DUF4838 domain-containing protein [Acidobacteriota bacterium]
MRLICTALMFCSIPGFAALDIVRDGAPAATVIVDANASAQVRDAAQLLVNCVEKATGATLPVQADLPDAGALICIGPGEIASSFGLHQDGLDEDGFDIAFPDAKTVVVLGPTDWGTEFGVCEFLERFVGVRWLLPGDSGTDIPRANSISIEPEPVRSEPAFFSRLFSGLSGKAQSDWARRNRMHGRISFHHNLIHLFPPETYTESNPEFFPVRADGTRFLPPTNDTHAWQPCFTAPGIVDEAIRNIVKYFDANPQATSYSLGTNDSSGYCRCENCLARISGEKNFLGLTDYSDLYYDWANQVIEGVLKVHPDKWFGCLAYSEVAAPPKNVNVHPRLIPYMTYDRMKWVDPEVRQPGEEATRRWEAKSPTVGWYDYIYGTPYVLPRVWFHHMRDYYWFGHTHGVRALYAEAYPNWGEGPKLYVSLKLQWNPYQDVDALLDEWYERCVGEEAAPFLKRYYEHWEDFWTRRAPGSRWFTRGGQYLSFHNPGYLEDIDLDEIRQSREWLEEAVAKADTEERKARANLLLRAFEYYEATAYAYKADTVPETQPITSVEQALAALDSAAMAAQYGAKRRQLALEVFPKDPVLVHPIPIDRNSLMSGANWGSGSIWRVYDLASDEGPVRAKVRELAKTSESEAVRDQANLMLRILDGSRESLLKNPSFEEGQGASATGWSWWVKFETGRMLRSSDVAHSGHYSVLCDGMKRGGPVQVLPIEPGNYGLTCFVYVPQGQQQSGTAELAMTLRDEQGNNLPSPSTKIVPAPGRWTALAIAHEVPAEVSGKAVKQVLPILIVDGFNPGDRLYIDDLSLVRLDN